jgi:hypothetical protein
MPSITRVNTTGQAASQNAESLIRSIMDPASLMSTVMNATGGDNKTQSSDAGPSHLKKSGSENNLTNTSTDLLNTVTKNTSGLSSPSQQQASAAATNRSSGSFNKNNIDNNGSNHTNNNSTTASTSMAPTTSMQNTIVTNVDTLLLAHQIIPPKDSIPIYDTSPYKILNGHLDAKIPCDANSAPSLQILVGHSPYLKPVQLHLVKEFSKPGNICMYDVDIGSETETVTTHGNNSIDKGGGAPQPQQQDNTLTNTVLVLSNPTDSTVTLPNTSTVIIGVNEIRS